VSPITCVLYRKKSQGTSTLVTKELDGVCDDAPKPGVKDSIDFCADHAIIKVPTKNAIPNSS
jgi:hypothetical protein